MKKIIFMFIGILSVGYMTNAVSTSKTINVETVNSGGVIVKNFQEMKDRMELQNLVYTFSTLSDTKDVDKQVLLFTEDAIVESERDGTVGSRFKGRKEIGDAFKTFLAQFETVYHINGQHTVEINGEKATGINYCQVVLIKNENGKKIVTTSGVRYSDEYKKINGKWHISNRKSNFMWTTVGETQ